jgi:lipopolysaccharide export system permease protein
MRTWNQYFLKELFKITFLFLSSFSLLYILIDYSMHIKLLSETPFHLVVLYYLCQLAKRADLLLPFALLVSTIKVLLSFNRHNELAAMLAAGVTLKKVLSPLLALALCCSAFLFLNFEYLEPLALKKINYLDNTYFDNAIQRAKNKKVNALSLKDHSKLVFNHFDQNSQSINEVYWIKDEDHIFHMQKLNLNYSPLIGNAVTEFQRNANHQFELTATQKTRLFKDLKIEVEDLNHSIFPIRSLSLSQLYHEQFSPKTPLSEVKTALHYKCAVPLLPLLVVITLSPFCTLFSRNTRTYLIYVFAIAGLLFFFTLINATYILGENQVLAPFLAIWLPFAAIALTFSLRYLKL